MHWAFAFPARRWVARDVLAAVIIAAFVPLPLAAAGAFRSASSTTVTTGDPTITKPAGVVDGDALVTVVATRPDTTTITAPAGWTLLLRLDNANASANSLAVYGKVAAAEPTSYSWNLTNANTGTALCTLAFSGIDTTVFSDGLNGQNTPSGFAHSTPSITPTYNNDVIVSFHAYASSNPWTPPVGMTEDIDVATLAAPNTAGMALECNHLLQGLAAPTGTLTATTVNDANIDVGNAIVLALKASNVAPVLDATRSPTLGTLVEDAGAPSGAVGVLVSSVADLTTPVGGLDNVTDSDGGAVAGIAMMASNAGLSCYYSLNGGTVWNSIGAVGTTTARLLAADSDNRLYCQGSSNANGSFSNALTIRAWDQTFGLDGAMADASTSGGSTAFSTATDTISLIVTAVNDAPTATNLSAAETYTEDTALNLIDIVASDIDSTTITATLTLSNTTAGSLTTGTSGAVTSTYNSPTGVWIAAGAIADVNTLLAGVTFIPAANSTGSFSITTSISDGSVGTSGSKSVTGIAVNDPPTATNRNAAETYTEDTARNLIDIVVSDIDNTTTTATLTLSSTTAGSLTTATSGAVTSTYSSPTGVWTASGPIADVNTLLAGVTFIPTANFNGSFSITTGIDDGSGGTLSGSKSVTGIAVNDPPTATNRNAAETYTEDTALNLIDIVVTDIDNATITASLTLSNTAAGSLTTATSGAVTSTYSNGTGVWIAAGAIADVNALLAGVTFLPIANYNGNFTITPNIDDGSGGTIAGSKSVTGTAVNDAPLLDASRSPTLGTVLEDAAAPSGAVGVLVSSLVDFVVPSGQVDNVIDVDSGAVIGVALVGANSSLTCYYSLDGGTTWSALGAVSNASAQLIAADADNRLYCQPNANVSGFFPSALTFRAWDQSAGVDGGFFDTSTSGGATAFSSATDTIGLAVPPVNDAPIATNMSAAESYTEDTVLNLTDIVATDVDSATVTATLTLTVPAAGNLSVGSVGTVTPTYDSVTGVWTAAGAIADVNAVLAGILFGPTANYNGSFNIDTRIDDGSGGVITGSKNMTGTALNDAPALDASKSPTLGALPEDASAPSGAVGVPVSSLVDFATPSGQVDNVTEVDAGAVTGIAIIAAAVNIACSYSLNGGTTWSSIGAVGNSNARLLAADADNRLYCQPNANLNGSFANALTFRAWDQTAGVDGGTADTGTGGGTFAFSVVTDGIGLTVTAVNDAPTATNRNAAETYTEDTALNLIDIVVTDIDNITTTATLTLSNPIAGSLTTATSGAVTSIYSSPTGVWSASGPIADVNTLLAGVTFIPASNFNGSFSIITGIDDGSGGTLGGSKSVTGFAVNDAPTTVADSIALNQGATATALVGGASSVLTNDTDVDGPSLAAQLATPPTHASVFFLNADGSFQYSHDNTGANSDGFVYRACDGGAPSLCSADTNVTIGVNLRPIAGCTVAGQLVSEGDAVSIALSGMLVDPEGQPLSFSAIGLPAGLNMSSAGQVAGTVAGGAQTGSPYLATITAQDPAAAAASRPWGVQVLAAGELVFRNGFDNPADATVCH